MKVALWRTTGIACCIGLSQSFTPLPHTFVGAHRLKWKSFAVSFDSTVMPRIQDADLAELESKGFVVIPDFLPADLQAALRQDVVNLRSDQKFNIAKIGQDSTNALNEDIRVAETCFIGPTKLKDVPSDARKQLYQVLDQVRSDLPGPLDPNLTELLYAYYPKGGFYRRHRDAIPGSASVLRSYSLLLYLNENWTPKDGGQLLLHRDSGADFLPEGEKSNFVQVAPKGGTLVLFQSDAVPHEVLDTNAERLAVVGWYNRPLSAGDISSLGGIDNSLQPVLLGLSAALVSIGLYTLLQS
jgi:SM-20-related protein